MDYEVSHVYLDGCLGAEQQRGIDIFNKIKGHNKTVSLLVDDYSLKHQGLKKINIKDIIVFYEKNGIKINDLKNESSFINIADFMLNDNESKIEKFRRDKKIAYFIKIGNSKIKIKETYFDNKFTKYSCVALSASWQLYRSGKWGDNKINKRQEYEITSILPKEYVDIENQVKIILKKYNCDIDYIFY